jgi:hypothetical protein
MRLHGGRNSMSCATSTKGAKNQEATVRDGVHFQAPPEEGGTERAQGRAADGDQVGHGGSDLLPQGGGMTRTMSRYDDDYEVMWASGEQKQRQFFTLRKICLQAEEMIIKYIMLKDARVTNDKYYANPLVTNDK